MPKLKQYKIARRLGAKVFPKTENPKFIIAPMRRRAKRGARQLSEFGAQLLEKQKVRYSYGVRERQFSNYVKESMARKGTNPTDELYKKLETRLDNVVFRLGLAKTRRFARQLVSHGHIVVNGRRVTIPSFTVSKGDTVGIRPESVEKPVFNELSETIKEHTPPAWLALDQARRTGKVVALPHGADAVDALFNLTAVIGYYSR